MADGDGSRLGWSAAWGVAAAITGGIGGTLWDSVATTGPRVLLWPAAVLSLAALTGLYMCFALLGGWWPASSATKAPTLIAGEYQPSDTAGVHPGLAVSGQVVVGDIPQQPPGFQPRAELLAGLDRAGLGVSVVHAVTGMRGVGKTQLAAAYARAKVAAGWRLVAWVNAEDTVGLLAGLAAVAEAVGLTEHGAGQDGADAGHVVRRRLETDGDRCLIVFDNASDADVLRPFIPAVGVARVLITSNRQAVANLGASVPIEVFTGEEATAFLADRTGLTDAAGAAEVAFELGFLPLAVAQAAAVIAGQRLGYGSYLDRLRALPVAEYLIRAEGQAYPHGVAEAVLLSLDAVQPGVCIGVMEMMAVLSAAGVRRDLLHAAGQAGALADDGRGAGVGPEVVDAALARLAEGSLLTFSLDGQVIIAHRLVMRVVRETLARQERLGSGCRITASVLEARAEALAGSQDRPAVRDFPEQVAALQEAMAGSGGEDDETTRLLLRLRFLAVYFLNDLEDSAPLAIAVGEPLVADYERRLGPEDIDTVSARDNLANSYRQAGRVAEAIALHEQALADYERVLGPDNPHTLGSRSNLAAAYLEAGRVAEAIALDEQVLAAFERTLGPDHPDTLSSLNNLAIGYQHAGRVPEAIALYEQVLAVRERVLGPDHPDTVSARSNLALGHQGAGRVAEAIALHEQVLAARERMLGPDHPDTLSSLNNLAIGYQQTGRMAEAIALHEQVLAARERMLGPDHPDTVKAREVLVIAYQAASRAG